jgi:predicted 2-oxoglutarate/Fe(II)-dependent dioxygenase YbiX
MSLTTVENFNKNGYVYLKDFLDIENGKQLALSLKNEVNKRGIFDSQCPGSKAIRDSEVFDSLLLELLPHIENASGLKLHPTYAYARWYQPGEKLKIHTDRAACEISVTLTLDFEGDSWPIYVGKPSQEETEYAREDKNGHLVYAKDVGKIETQPGDGVLYKGTEMYHWRDEYTQGKWQAQVFLHYVDANGRYRDWIYDKRTSLNIPDQKDLTAWVYNDILSEKDCDMLIKLYTQAPDEEAKIGSGGTNSTVDKTVRNVNRVILPVYKGIGARLAAAGLDANAKRWKFDITKANQSEFLKYPTGGGRYKGHIDTHLMSSKESESETRKLTVLAFLNDDFKGGKFFLQIGHEKIYPPQKKGTVLVFPSFILHGVEDVEEGERYSVVTWMVGPWFK